MSLHPMEAHAALLIVSVELELDPGSRHVSPEEWEARGLGTPGDYADFIDVLSRARDGLERLAASGG